MEKEYAVNGKVFGVLKKPIPNAQMTMFGRNRGMALLNTTANEKGEFTFTDLPLMDSASFIIQAKNMKGKKGAATIEVDEFKAPLFRPIVKRVILADVQLDSVTKSFIDAKTQEAKMTFKAGITLNEVSIVGKRVIKGSKNLNGPGEADLTIAETELNKVAKKSLFELLQEKVPGFLAGLRSKAHPRDFYIDSRLLRFVIDGTSVDFFYQAEDNYYYFIRRYLDNYFAEDISGIELMKSYKYSFTYGSEFLDKPGEIAWIEITTRGGFGAFLKGVPSIYVYNPINSGEPKPFNTPR